ncbi:MAG: DUF4105 domain-containing protein [Saprospiraceae bacterium]|nr:DUF4105 domain-containing protein [Saprospiraceae bacterium]
MVVAALTSYAIWFSTREPVQDDNWKSAYRVLPEIHLNGDTLHINHLRDFRYDTDGNVLEERYQKGTYRLSSLKGVWFGLSHFGPAGLAHAFASFEFADGQFLAVSIEARLREDQDHYDPLTGAFRGYTKFVVLATEQDVIGIRSHLRKSPVYLYPLNGSALQGRALLLNFLRRADNLGHTPDFYNTLTDNCLTGLLAESGRYTDLHHWLDYRILLPGYSDEVLFEHNILNTQISMDATRAKARVDSTITPDDPDFSKKIRSTML